MKKSLLFVFTFINLVSYKLAYCGQNIEIHYSHSKPRTAEERVLIDLTVAWQTGCTFPDLSQSTEAGSTTLNIFLDGDGNPRKIEVAETTGSSTENNIIIAAIKRCNFARRVGIEDVPSYFNITFVVNWNPGEQEPKTGLQTCLRRPYYPLPARRLKQEGTVIWAVRPTKNNQFEKKLLVDSNSKSLNQHTEKELDRCLQNPDVAQSIRDHYKDDKWEEFGADYQLPK
jgi:hypothetical protein